MMSLELISVLKWNCSAGQCEASDNKNAYVNFNLYHICYSWLFSIYWLYFYYYYLLI